MLNYKNDISNDFGDELRNLHCSVGFYLGYVSNSMRNSLTKTFHDNGYDITHAQWLILMMLWMKDGRQQNELTELIFKEKTTITRLIDNLEKKNLLVRVTDLIDKRSKLIYLTNSGKELKNKLTPLVIELNHQASEGISSEELELLKTLMMKIYNNLNENV